MVTTNHEIFSEEAIDKEYQKSGSFNVSLARGLNYLIAEQYFCIREEDATRFFAGASLDPGEQRYRDREYIKEGAGPDGCDIGIGFDRVELYIHGELVEKK